MKKTYKREVASAMLVYTLGMFAWSAAGNEAAGRVADTMLPWSMMLVIAAFGFEAVTQQLLPMMRPGPKAE